MSDVRVVFSKWGDRPHWEFAAIRLGEDEHGVWIGAPAGTPTARPGVEFTPEYDQVALVPHTGSFEATFYAPGAPDEIIALAVESCEDVRTRVESEVAPYDGVTGRQWLARLAQVIMEP